MKRKQLFLALLITNTILYVGLALKHSSDWSTFLYLVAAAAWCYTAIGEAKKHFVAQVDVVISHDKVEVEHR